MSKEMDDRFSQVVSDPRFRTLRKTDKKVKVDKRFDKMFTEKRFKLKYSVDKRGKQTNDAKEDYKKFYNMSEKASEDEDKEDKVEEQTEDIETKVLKKPKLPNARGIDSEDESESMSSSSESEDSSDENEEIDHNWNEWDKDVPKTESMTRRLAICSLDWDRINANDLFVLLNSFKPSNASIISVKIYPSELGLQRMKAESESGPLQFFKTNESHKIDVVSNEENNNNEEQETDDPKIIEELRQYEMMRLKYYYAVVECDTSLTAEVLYNELDGMEYESSSTAMDLRFIDDDITFDEQTVPKSECYSMPDLSSYKAPQFINSALQQSKVRMTWDQTDPKRKEVFDRAFNKNDDNDDLKAYLATSEEEDSEDDEDIEEFGLSDESNLKTKDRINKYKDLLNSLNDAKEERNEDNLEMEISWEPNLKDVAEVLVNKNERNKDMSVFEQNFSKKKEQRKQMKNNINSEDESNSEEEEEYITQQTNDKSKDKRKHKKKNKNSNETNDPNLELLFMDSSDVSDKKHFNYKNIVENESNPKKRKEKPNNDSFKFNADDPRFGAVYTSHHYNVDPSDPHFKKTEAFEQMMNKSTKKIKSNELENQSSSDGLTKSTNSWNQLVRNVKNKSQSIQNRKSNKFQIKQNKFKS